MTVFAAFEVEFKTISDQLVEAGSLPKGIDSSRVVFEVPRDETHGDLATNAAMVLAKQAGMKPSDLAKIFAVHLAKLDGVTAVDIAGPALSICGSRRRAGP